MHWKEFLRPNGRKIVVFVILFFIIGCLYLRFVIGEKCIEGFGDVEIGELLPMIYIDEKCVYNLILLGAPVILICSYLISCLIVSIYYKHKKK